MCKDSKNNLLYAKLYLIDCKAIIAQVSIGLNDFQFAQYDIENEQQIDEHCEDTHRTANMKICGDRPHNGTE